MYPLWAATSKFDQLVDKDTNNGSFGSRGEALASISDVSLLEIVTKAFGRPNGYRKVMKVWIILLTKEGVFKRGCFMTFPLICHREANACISEYVTIGRKWEQQVSTLFPQNPSMRLWR